MLILLKTVLNHWKKVEPWIWRILFNGFQQKWHFHGVSIFTWTTLSLNTRWLLNRNSAWIAHLCLFVNWMIDLQSPFTHICELNDLLSPLNYIFPIYYEIRDFARRSTFQNDLMLLNLILFSIPLLPKWALTWCRSIGSQSSIHLWWLFSSRDWCLWY